MGKGVSLYSLGWLQMNSWLKQSSCLSHLNSQGYRHEPLWPAIFFFSFFFFPQCVIDIFFYPVFLFTTIINTG